MFLSSWYFEMLKAKAYDGIALLLLPQFHQTEFRCLPYHRQIRKAIALPSPFTTSNVLGYCQF